MIFSCEMGSDELTPCFAFPLSHQVKKYVMSDEDYDKYPKSLRAYVKERRKVDPTFKLFPRGDPTAPKPDVESPECVAGITVGSRCEVAPGGRRGEVAFVGLVPALATGYWVRLLLCECVCVELRLVACVCFIFCLWCSCAMVWPCYCYASMCESVSE